MKERETFEVLSLKKKTQYEFFLCSLQVGRKAVIFLEAIHVINENGNNRMTFYTNRFNIENFSRLKRLSS